MTNLDFNILTGSVFGYCGLRSNNNMEFSRKEIAEKHLKFLEEKGKIIRSDSDLNSFSEFDFFTIDDFIEKGIESNSVYFFGDMAEYLNSRQTMTRFSKLMTYWMSQLRRKDSIWIYNTRNFGELDKRVRRESLAFDCFFEKDKIKLTHVGTKEIFYVNRY